MSISFFNSFSALTIAIKQEIQFYTAFKDAILLLKFIIHEFMKCLPFSGHSIYTHLVSATNAFSKADNSDLFFGSVKIFCAHTELNTSSQQYTAWCTQKHIFPWGVPLESRVAFSPPHATAWLYSLVMPCNNSSTTVCYTFPRDQAFLSGTALTASCFHLGRIQWNFRLKFSADSGQTTSLNHRNQRELLGTGPMERQDRLGCSLGKSISVLGRGV